MSKDILTKVQLAKSASIPLASVSGTIKNSALAAMAQALDSNREKVISANKIDTAAAEKLALAGKLSGSLVKRLKPGHTKVDELTEGVRDVLRFNEPVGKSRCGLELDSALELSQVSC